MTLTRRAFGRSGISLLALAAATRAGFAQSSDNLLTGAIEGTEEFGIATDAYIYGYWLVTMEMTRRIMTNVAALETTRAPMGNLLRMRSYPDATYKDVTAPNADTLYTTAWFDVGQEPWVLDQPDMGNCYSLLPFLSGWTEVFEVPGARTTGGAAKTFLITGPGRTGTVPDGMTQLKSPTAMVWLLGRIYCTGTPEDYHAVHKLQPLSTWGTDFTPPAGTTVDASIDMKTPTRDQVNAMTTSAYFTLLADLMKANPAAAADAPALERFVKIGLVPGQPFDATKLGEGFDTHVPKASFDRILGHLVASDGDIDPHQRLVLYHQGRGLWHQLHPARLGHGHWHGRQPARRCGLSDLAETRSAAGIQRRRQLCAQVRKGPDATGQGILVADDV